MILETVGVEHEDESSISDNDSEEKKKFYRACLQETCTQICMCKPTLLTRHNDLVMYARQILDNCHISRSKLTNSKAKR